MPHGIEILAGVVLTVAGYVDHLALTDDALFDLAHDLVVRVRELGHRIEIVTPPRLVVWGGLLGFGRWDDRIDLGCLLLPERDQMRPICT